MKTLEKRYLGKEMKFFHFGKVKGVMKYREVMGLFSRHSLQGTGYFVFLAQICAGRQLFLISKVIAFHPLFFINSRLLDALYYSSKVSTVHYTVILLQL